MIEGETVGSKTVPIGGSGTGATYDPKTKEFFFPNAATGSVTVINSSDKVATTIKGFASPVDALYVPKNGMVYVFESANSSLYLINPKSDAVTLAINLGTLGFKYSYLATYPFMLYSATSKEIYVVETPADGCSPCEGSVWVVNPVDNKLVTTISLAGSECATSGCFPDSIGYDGANGNIYVGDIGTTGNIYVISPENNYQSTNVFFSGDAIVGFAYDPMNQELYIANGGNNYQCPECYLGGVFMMNSTGTITSVSSQYWDYPAQLVYNTNNDWVYVINRGSEGVLPINGSTPESLIKLDTQLSEIVAT